MSILIKTRDGGEIVYKKFDSHAFVGIGDPLDSLRYHRDDPTFEQHRKQDNSTALSYVAKELKKMRIEARNGFKGLSEIEQSVIISNRKKEIENILRERGSFLSDEIPDVINRTSRLVERIYASYTN